MRKYTFIAEYKGGTYISQFVASNLAEALPLWAMELDGNIFSKSAREQILSEVNEVDFSPVLLKKIENVWCATYLSEESFLLLNIVETV